MDFLAGHCEKRGVRVVEFSIQGNHIHVICEAIDNEALSKTRIGLLSGLARVLNHHWGRMGKAQEDCYHVQFFTTPRQCRNALLYVLHNAKKHGRRIAGADPCSTAPSFPSTSHGPHRTDAKPAADPGSGLQNVG